jgi:hypothetical protein
VVVVLRGPFVWTLDPMANISFLFQHCRNDPMWYSKYFTAGSQG